MQAALLFSVSQSCMRSCRPFCWGVAGLDAFNTYTKAQPPDRKFGQAEQGIG